MTSDLAIQIAAIDHLLKINECSGHVFEGTLKVRRALIRIPSRCPTVHGLWRRTQGMLRESTQAFLLIAELFRKVDDAYPDRPPDDLMAAELSNLRVQVKTMRSGLNDLILMSHAEVAKGGTQLSTCPEGTLRAAAVEDLLASASQVLDSLSSQMAQVRQAAISFRNTLDTAASLVGNSSTSMHAAGKLRLLWPATSHEG